MKTEIEPLSDYQEFFNLLCSDDFNNIKKLIKNQNTNKCSKLSQLVSQIITISLYSPSFELFDFYTKEYQSLNDYEKELLKSISKKQNIHFSVEPLSLSIYMKLIKNSTLLIFPLHMNVFCCLLIKTMKIPKHTS